MLLTENKKYHVNSFGICEPKIDSSAIHAFALSDLSSTYGRASNRTFFRRHLIALFRPIHDRRPIENSGHHEGASASRGPVHLARSPHRQSQSNLVSLHRFSQPVDKWWQYADPCYPSICQGKAHPAREGLTRVRNPRDQQAFRPVVLIAPHNRSRKSYLETSQRYTRIRDQWRGLRRRNHLRLSSIHHRLMPHPSPRADGPTKRTASWIVPGR